MLEKGIRDAVYVDVFAKLGGKSEELREAAGRRSRARVASRCVIIVFDWSVIMTEAL
jgi:hypothetical protein